MRVPKCSLCGQLGVTSLTVFFDGLAEEKSYCEKHVPLEISLPFGSVSIPAPREMEDAIAELSQLIAREQCIPTRIRLLPTGRSNPLYGRTDLENLSVEEMLSILNTEEGS